MKKSIFLLGVAVAAMTSCSNDKLLDQAEPIQRAIGFEAFTNNATKAVTETTASGLTQFMAYGYYMAPDITDPNSTTTTVFDGTAVVGNANTSVWDYTSNNPTNLKYWTANNYWFAGYANKNASTSIADVEFYEAGTTTKYGVLSIPNYTATDDEDLVADVVFVDNTGNNPQNVSLSFDHLLTKVQFTVINNDSKYKMRITSALEVNGIQTTADCEVTSTAVTWSNHETDLEDFVPVATTEEDEYLAPDARSTSTVYFVLPQDLENVTFSVTGTFYDDNNQIVNTKVLTTKPVSSTDCTSWENGCYYNYIISLPTSAKPIIFNKPGVDTWDNAIEIELNASDSDSDADA